MWFPSMRNSSAFCLSLFGVFACLASPYLLSAQRPAPRQIIGQVHISGETAPAGLSVSLQIAASQSTTPDEDAIIARSITDEDGKYVFAHVETIGDHHGKELFLVSAEFPAHKLAFQFADLRVAAVVTANLDLQPESDTPAAKDTPEVADSSNAAPAIDHQPLGDGAPEALARAQEKLFRKHDPQGSLEDLKRLVQIDPWYAPGFLLLGLANMQLQRWSDAQKAFEQATKAEPGNAQAFLGIGSAMNEQKSYEAAEKTLEHALELKPDSAEAHYELARSLWGLGKVTAAEEHTGQAIELKKDYSGPHALMGNIKLQHEEPEAALAEFQEYLRLDPQGSLAPEVKEMVEKLKKAVQQ